MTDNNSFKTRRASSDNVAMECPASMHPAKGEITVNPVDSAGAVGSATHKWIEDHIKGVTRREGYYAARYQLSKWEARDAEILGRIGVVYYRELTEDMELICLEKPMHDRFRGITHTGHADVILMNTTASGKILTVVDWKTTRLETTSYWDQVKRYLWLAFEAFEHMEADYYIGITAFLRDMTVDVSDPMTAEQLEGYCEEYYDKVESWNGTEYCPGGHCGYCPRQLNCPGLLGYLEQAKALTLGTPPESHANAPTENLPSVYEELKTLERHIGGHVDAIKKVVMGMEGHRACGNQGKDLIMASQVQTEINYGRGKKTLLQYMDQDELNAATKVSKTILMDTVAEKAPRGMKKKMKDQVMTDLQKAEAVTTGTQWRPRLVKSIPGLEVKAIAEEN